MFQFLNALIMFITIVSTIKMLFLTNKKIKKDAILNPNTTSIYSKEKLNEVSIVNTIDNTSYYIDIDNCVDELQLTHINPNSYVYA